MKKGFTLLELLIVVVIIGVLALVAVPSLLNATTKAKEGVVKANVDAATSTVASQFALDESATAADVAGAAADKLIANNATNNPFTEGGASFTKTADAVIGTVTIVGAGDQVTITGYGATTTAILTKVIDAPEVLD